MLIKPRSIITSLKLSIVLVLLITIFFFQHSRNPTTKELTTYKFGVEHRPNLNITNNSRLFFSSVLKSLAAFSTVPLIIKIAAGSIKKVVSLGK